MMNDSLVWWMFRDNTDNMLTLHHASYIIASAGQLTSFQISWKTIKYLMKSSREIFSFSFAFQILRLQLYSIVIQTECGRKRATGGQQVFNNFSAKNDLHLSTTIWSLALDKYAGGNPPAVTSFCKNWFTVLFLLFHICRDGVVSIATDLRRCLTMMNECVKAAITFMTHDNVD